MSLWTGFIIDLKSVSDFYLQRGQKLSVRSTEIVSWVWPSMAHEAPGLPSDSTSLPATSMVPTNRCSATAAQDTAGVWTKMDRRSPGPKPVPAADQCVSKSLVLKPKLYMTYEETQNKNIKKANFMLIWGWFLNMFSIRYRPQCCSTTCRPHH